MCKKKCIFPMSLACVSVQIRHCEFHLTVICSASWIQAANLAVCFPFSYQLEPSLATMQLNWLKAAQGCLTQFYVTIKSRKYKWKIPQIVRQNWIENRLWCHLSDCVTGSNSSMKQSWISYKAALQKITVALFSPSCVLIQ